LSFAAGTYTGHRFYSAGGISAQKSCRLASSSGSPVSRRALINGRTRYLMSGGLWNGYWMSAQTGVALH